MPSRQGYAHTVKPFGNLSYGHRKVGHHNSRGLYAVRY